MREKGNWSLNRTRHMMLDTTYVVDLLIGTMAVQHAEPLVTGDMEHFGRIDALVLLSYRQ